MKPTKKPCYESFLLVKGTLQEMLDMFRYDSCFPASEAESARLQRDEGRQTGLVVLCRRSLSGLPVTDERWRSFGCEVIGEFKERFEAEDVRARMQEAPR